MSTQDHLQLEKKEQEDDDKNELTGIGGEFSTKDTNLIPPPKFAFISPMHN